MLHVAAFLPKNATPVKIGRTEGFDQLIRIAFCGKKNRQHLLFFCFPGFCVFSEAGKSTVDHQQPHKENNSRVLIPIFAVQPLLPVGVEDVGIGEGTDENAADHLRLNRVVKILTMIMIDLCLLIIQSSTYISDIYSNRQR